METEAQQSQQHHPLLAAHPHATTYWSTHLYALRAWGQKQPRQAELFDKWYTLSSLVPNARCCTAKYASSLQVLPAEASPASGRLSYVHLESVRSTCYITHALQGPLSTLKQALLLNLVDGILCMAAIHVDFGICRSGLTRLAPGFALMMGAWLRQLWGHAQGSSHMLPGTTLRRIITIHRLGRLRRERAFKIQLQMWSRWASGLFPRMPSHELACIAILLSAILIGMVSLTHPMVCYASNLVALLLVSIAKTSGFKCCFHMAKGAIAEHACNIAWLAESLIWSLIFVKHCCLTCHALFLAVIFASMQTQHSIAETAWPSEDAVMGMPSQLLCPLSGGGADRTIHRTRARDVWQANSTGWFATEEIHQATIAAQTRLVGTSLENIQMRRFVDFRRTVITSHSSLLSTCRNFAALAHRVLSNEGTEHVPDTFAALIASLHCGVASSITFSDNMHWRCIHFDPVRRKVLCMDLYGNGKPTIRFSQDLKAALQTILRQYCPDWEVEETVLKMQLRSDEHSCGVWTIWMADQWMQFVQAGLPDPGFEHWLSLKLKSPLPTGEVPQQHILRRHYGQMITEVGAMDPVDTRPLFRPAYFSNLYAYWLSQRGDEGGLCMQRLARNLSSRQNPTNDPIDLRSPSPGSTPAKAPACRQALRIRQPPGHLACMDGRQAKANGSIAPIAQTTRTKTKRIQHPGCKKSAAGSCPTQARTNQAGKIHAPSADACKADAPPMQPCKKQRCIAECWVKPTCSQPSAHAPAGQTHPPSQGPPASPRSTLYGIKLLCWNVMGLTTVRDELELLVQQQDPDVIVLTETKLTDRSQRKSWLNSISKTHWLQFSSSPHEGFRTGERQGRGGLAVAVRKTLVPEGCYTRLPVQSQHRSHLLQLMLQPPNSTPVLLQAVYMPFDLQARANIYEAIKEACEGQHSIVAGDMNAALFPRDRSQGCRTAIDKQHEAFVAQNVLLPADEVHRPFSHTVRSLESTQEASRSRIDDILVTSGIKRHLAVPCAESASSDRRLRPPAPAGDHRSWQGWFCPPLGPERPDPLPGNMPKVCLPYPEGTATWTFRPAFSTCIATKFMSLTLNWMRPMTCWPASHKDGTFPLA